MLQINAKYKMKTPYDSVRGHVRVRQFILICVRGRSASAKNLADGRQSADTVRVRTTLADNAGNGHAGTRHIGELNVNQAGYNIAGIENIGE